MVHAIILAGGRSSRMSDDTLKQYRRVNNDKMLITYSIETLIHCPQIDDITVVIEDEAWEDLIRGDVANRGLSLDKLQNPFWKARIYNRQSAVVEGIKAAYGWRTFKEEDISEEDILIIHDASRPYITEKMILDCLDSLEKCDGAVLMNGFEEQTPAAFHARKYYRANEQLIKSKVDLENISCLTAPAIEVGMKLKNILGYDNKNIETEVDWNDLQKRMQQTLVG